MIPKLMNEGDISEITSTLRITIEAFFNEIVNEMNPHWVVEDEDYWIASKVMAHIKQTLDKTLSQKLARMESEVDHALQNVRLSPTVEKHPWK